MNELCRLPIFPLHTVLFPGMLLPLHIFEQRYLRLVRDCTESRGPFGVALIARGEEVGDAALPHLVGTSARITAVEPREDTSLDVLCVGERRFCIERMVEGAATPYAAADVRWLPDDLPDSRQAAEVAAAVRPLAAAYVAALRELVPTWRPPTFADDLTANELSYRIAALMQIGRAARQELLEAPTTTDRLQKERALLAAEAAVLRNVIRLGRVASPLGPYQPSVN